MSNVADSKETAGLEVEAHRTSLNQNADLDEKAKLADYKADAIEAETVEFNMGVLEAVRAYPMASIWAFIMSCTIVRHHLGPPIFRVGGAQLTPFFSSSSSYRSWSPTVSSSLATSSPYLRSRTGTASGMRQIRRMSLKATGSLRSRSPGHSVP